MKILVALLGLSFAGEAQAAMTCWQVTGWSVPAGATREHAQLYQTGCKVTLSGGRWAHVVYDYGFPAVDDIWIQLYGNDSHINSDGDLVLPPFYDGMDSNNKPIIALDVYVGGSSGYPLVTNPPDPCAPDASWTDGYSAHATYDTANCQVREVPAGESGFVWNNRFYLQPDESTPDCPMGYYDSANCAILHVPHGTTPYTQGGMLYVNQPAGTSCVGIQLNNQCAIGYVPPYVTPFVYNDILYTTAPPTCNYGTYDGANCLLGDPPSGKLGFLWPDDQGSFYYDP